MLNLRWKPEIIYWLIAFCIGIFYVFFLINAQTPDQRAHFFRVYQLSTGQLLGLKVGNISGGYIPKYIYEQRIGPNLHIKFSKKDTTIAITKHISAMNKTQLKYFPNSVLYSPVAYVPQIFGMLLGRLLHLNTYGLLVISRLFGLLCCISIVYYAIKIIPIFKWGMTALALIPLVINQMSSVSADAMMLTTAILFFSLILKYSFKECKIRRKDMLFLSLIYMILCLTKQGYFGLILLYFLLPLNKFVSKKSYFFCFIFIFLMGIIPMFCWSLLVKTIYVPFTIKGIYPNVYQQMLFIFSHPLIYIEALFKCILQIRFNNFFATMFVPTTIYMAALTVPQMYLYVICSIMYFYFICLCSVFSRDKYIFTLRQRILLLLIVCLGYVMTATIAYVGFSSVGSVNIQGYQLRYMLPFIIVLPFAFCGILHQKKSVLIEVVRLENVGVFVMIMISALVIHGQIPYVSM